MERTVEGTSALYGSVTPRIICEAVRKQLNISLPEIRVVLPEPIRTIGMHRVPLRLPPMGQLQGPEGVDCGSTGGDQQITFMSVLVKDINEPPKVAAEEATDPSLLDPEGGDPDGPTKKKDKQQRQLGRKERLKKGK